MPSFVGCTIAPTCGRGSPMTRRRSLIALGALTALLIAGTAQALEVGEKAPEFSLPGPGNKPVKLSELTAKGPVVLYTLIQAFTPT
jgi:hypothetical protein